MLSAGGGLKMPRRKPTPNPTRNRKESESPNAAPPPAARTSSPRIDSATGEPIRKVWRNDGRGNYLARHMPGHPLASKSGRCLAHRVSLFEKLGGADADCAWCQRPLTWAISPPSSELIGGRAALTVDHLDGDPTNNLPSNLVPTCLGCNFRRRVKPSIPPPAPPRAC